MATLTKDEILDAIGAMSVLELSELLTDFEEKFGVTAAAPVAAVAAAPAGGGDAGAAAEEEKDNFDVVLTGAGDKKIAGHQGGPRADQCLGLKDAKAMVEEARARSSSRAPPRPTPRRPRPKLEEAGASVELK